MKTPPRGVFTFVPVAALTTVQVVIHYRSPSIPARVTLNHKKTGVPKHYGNFACGEYPCALPLVSELPDGYGTDANPHRAPKAHDEWVDGRTGHQKKRSPTELSSVGDLLVTRTGIEPMFSP